MKTWEIVLIAVGGWTAIVLIAVLISLLCIFIMEKMKEKNITLKESIRDLGQDELAKKGESDGARDKFTEAKKVKTYLQDQQMYRDGITNVLINGMKKEMVEKERSMIIANPGMTQEERYKKRLEVLKEYEKECLEKNNEYFKNSSSSQSEIESAKNLIGNARSIAMKERIDEIEQEHSKEILADAEVEGEKGEVRVEDKSDSKVLSGVNVVVNAKKIISEAFNGMKEVNNEYCENAKKRNNEYCENAKKRNNEYCEDAKKRNNECCEGIKKINNEFCDNMHRDFEESRNKMLGILKLKQIHESGNSQSKV